MSNNLILKTIFRNATRALAVAGSMLVANIASAETNQQSVAIDKLSGTNFSYDNGYNYEQNNLIQYANAGNDKFTLAAPTHPWFQQQGIQGIRFEDGAFEHIIRRHGFGSKYPQSSTEILTPILSQTVLITGNFTSLLLQGAATTGKITIDPYGEGYRVEAKSATIVGTYGKQAKPTKWMRVGLDPVVGYGPGVYQIVTLHPVPPRD